jgi:hypothetical protein
VAPLLELSFYFFLVLGSYVHRHVSLPILLTETIKASVYIAIPPLSTRFHIDCCGFDPNVDPEALAEAQRELNQSSRG